MIRLDKYLANIGLGSRRTLPYLIKSGAVSIDGEPVLRPDQKIGIGSVLLVGDQEIEVKNDVSVLLHKPAGYVSSDVAENTYPSYKDLLQDCVYANLMHIAGRLDVDTTGLVLCSSDGVFVHRIISPKTHIEKEYIVRCAKPLHELDLARLERGVVLDDGYKTLPAKTHALSEYQFSLTLHEGKFHQVKRMLLCVGNEVTELHRKRIGPRDDSDLEVGKRKYINDAEKTLKDFQKTIV